MKNFEKNFEKNTEPTGETEAGFDPAVMLYVAGELDAAGRRAVETRLAKDAALRNQLGQLSAMDGMLRADAGAGQMPAADSRHALKLSIRLVREQALLLRDRPAGSGQRHLVNLPRWAWGSAVAALLAVGFVVWVSNSEPTGVAPSPIARVDEGENTGFSSAFVTIRPEMTDDAGNEIDNQVDALNLLATMTSEVN